MKKSDCRLAREQIELTTSVVILGTSLVHFAIALFELLSMAFNYSDRTGWQIARP
ncbi:hypothetical protein NX722_24325 [Endozoicomonas gorgoniicola]|uniref:Uncharacterized protein n=1 Tax=Endozoicomonas gorgoniicola TaxID=1234144 RepID=A0ABT3N233_9GAMM|nr:hypothetical protein [Endozoicomonas gorgoniicola]MCW7555697.1 hypothetical protein [Endozoicomonas gorgoniicola]